MQVIKNERVIYVDVDDTLVMHNYNSGNYADLVEVKCPIDGRLISVYKNRPMLRLVREERHRGAFIIVHCKGGYAWAEAVVKALGIEDQVDFVMSKPFAYFDDKPVEQWLTDRVYFGPDVKYKT